MEKRIGYPIHQVERGWKAVFLNRSTNLEQHVEQHLPGNDSWITLTGME